MRLSSKKSSGCLFQQFRHHQFCAALLVFACPSSEALGDGFHRLGSNGTCKRAKVSLFRKKGLWEKCIQDGCATIQAIGPSTVTVRSY